MNFKKGFTLVEVIIASTLLVMIFYFGTIAIRFVSDGSKRALNEYTTQSATRVAAQSISKSVKNSSAMFILPRGTYDVNALSAKWNYLVIETVSVDGGEGSAIVQYMYNPDRSTAGHPAHDRVILVAPKKNIFYSLEVNRDTSSGGAATENNLENKLVSYKIVAKDEKGNEIYTENPIESEVQALNTIQVVDLGTDTDIGVGFAFSSDAIEHQTAPEDIFVGHVAMVLDATGSMKSTLPNSGGKTRTMAMREAATKMVSGLAKEKNFFIKPIKYHNYAMDVEYNGSNLGFMDMSNQDQVELLLEVFNVDNYKGGDDHLVSQYATNTGDGLRKALYDLTDFNASYERTIGNKYKNYLILLTDGASNIYGLDRSGSYNTGRNLPYNTGMTADSDVSYKSGGDYAKFMGNYFINNLNGTKVYFVCLDLGLDSANIKGTIEGLQSTNNYTAKNISELNAVFETIRKSIVEDLWYVNGPQLKQR